MPTVYISKDAGLPAFYASTAGSLARFTNYKLILKACLVNGYGSKSAAGWALVAEGDTYLVLRNASGNYATFSSGYNFNSANLANHGILRVYLHASYTGIVGGVPQGLGVVSGNRPGNSVPHHFGTDIFYWAATGTRWAVVADDKTFIFSIYPASSAATAAIGPNMDNVSGAGTLYVGDDLAGNFIAAGGNLATAVANGGQQTNFFSSVEITALTNPKTGLLVDTGGIDAELEGAAQRTSTVNGTGSTSTASQSPGLTVQTPREITTLEMGQVRWYAANQTQAGLRGIRTENMLQRLYSFALRQSLEGSTTVFSGDTIITPPAVLADGHSYLPLLANWAGRKAMIITTNPDYW